MIINFLKNNFYEFWIALRYTRLKSRNFISFISLTSIIGITLGVTALIVVLSVMNGFKSELQSKILSVASDIEVRKIGANLKDWRQLRLNFKDLIIADAEKIEFDALNEKLELLRNLTI